MSVTHGELCPLVVMTMDKHLVCVGRRPAVVNQGLLRTVRPAFCANKMLMDPERLLLCDKFPCESEDSVPQRNPAESFCPC